MENKHKLPKANKRGKIDKATQILWTRSYGRYIDRQISLLYLLKLLTLLLKQPFWWAAHISSVCKSQIIFFRSLIDRYYFITGDNWIRTIILNCWRVPKWQSPEIKSLDPRNHIQVNQNYVAKNKRKSFQIWLLCFNIFAAPRRGIIFRFFYNRLLGEQIFFTVRIY